jgi:hypothetical protein
MILFLNYLPSVFIIILLFVQTIELSLDGFNKVHLWSTMGCKNSTSRMVLCDAIFAHMTYENPFG